MHAASSSRIRRGRPNRELSTDAIEDGGSSRRATQDEVMEDDEVPRRKTKGKAKSERGQVAAIDEEDEGEDPLDDIPDQPLAKGQLQKLLGLGADWDMVRTRIHHNSFNLVKDVASSLSEFADGDQGEKSLIEMDNLMRQLIDTDNVLQSHHSVLTSLHKAILGGEEINNVVDRYEQGYADLQHQYTKKTSRQKYAKSDDYAKFRQTIFEVQNPGQAAPPLTDFISKEGGDDSDDEDDVQVGGITQDYRCPISLTILVDPVTSESCGHSYSKEAIKEFMGNKAFVMCPASGCNKSVTLRGLQPNKELAKQAKEAARRERMRDEEDESDEDDVVE